MAAYSPAAVFASETAAMTITIYLGNAVIANELLSNTKGRLMGWGFVAFGYGLAFAVGILIFGHISAHLNPAMCLMLLIIGRIGGAEFAAAVAGEFLGAFLGACLVWLHFLVHFKTVPEPPSRTPEDLLLRTRDALTPTALGIASYNTRPDDVAARERGIADVANVFEDIKFFLRDNSSPAKPVDTNSELVRVALGPDDVRQGVEGIMNKLRRRSVQVCDVHRRLKDVDLEDFKNLMITSNSNSALNGSANGSNGNGNGNGGGNASSDGGVSRISSAAELSTPHHHHHHHHHQQQQQQQQHGAHHPAAIVVTKHEEKLDKLYHQALIADANAKLSIFCTRPALYSPFFNFLTEFMCTTMVMFGAAMIYARRDLLYGPERALFRSTEGLTIGFFLFVVILGLGGPTGIAANPARDFAPRLAHALLPIPGKGRSEWYYSWIPVVAPLLGGCAGAGLFTLAQMLNHSVVPGDQIFPGSGVAAASAG